MRDQLTKTGRFGRKMLQSALILGFTILCGLSSANAQTRIKDIVDFEGVRENMLIGYGLVVGLNGTATLPYQVPTTTSLVGVQVLLQAGCTDKTANTAGVTASNGLSLRLGN